MSARSKFRECLRERRRFRKDSLDWLYLTKAARTYLKIMRGIPTNQWSKK